MKLYAGGYLTYYMPDQRPEFTCELSEPVGLDEFLMSMGVPVAEIQLVVVNGEIVELKNAQINNQDLVKVFPGVDGG